MRELYGISIGCNYYQKRMGLGATFVVYSIYFVVDSIQRLINDQAFYNTFYRDVFITKTTQIKNNITIK